MLDSDDVLLLREIVAVPVFDRGTADPESVLHAATRYGAGPFRDPTPGAKQTPALLRTEYAWIIDEYENSWNPVAVARASPWEAP
jgi:hypothetical protein